jgi:toxin ParE1/3/4
VTQKWFLSPKAVSQLAEIYNYSLDTWGEDQAERYVQELLNTFDRVATDSSLGRPIPSEFQVDGRFTRCGKHIIYWRRFDDGTIGIVAILHERMIKTDRLRAAFGDLPPK